MPTVTLERGPDGKLRGISAKDERAYAKFRHRLDTLDGSIVFSWQEPRSGPFHRRFFAILNRLYEAQEQFQDIDHLLTWMKVGAGFVDLVPGPNGKPVALARSIAFHRLDQAEFEPIASAIWVFSRSIYCTRFLWPHLDDDQGMGMAESVLAEFGE